jgi:hypothetical protein
MVDATIATARGGYKELSRVVRAGRVRADRRVSQG